MFIETIDEATAKVHKLAIEKGWYEGEERRPLEIHALITTEIAEATECVRNGEPYLHYGKISGDLLEGAKRCGIAVNSNGFLLEPSEKLCRTKPEGEAIELADAVIRIMDYFGRQGWGLNDAISLKYEYNRTRAQRHGGKLK